MNKLKRTVIDVLEEKYSDDLCYLEEKKDLIATMDTLSTILWMNNLDSSNVEAIAARYNIGLRDFFIMLDTLKKIEG
jgi:hypothetical protein